MLLPVLREGGSRQPGHLPGAGAAAGTRATGGGPAWYAAVHLCAWEGPTEMLLEICGGGGGGAIISIIGSGKWAPYGNVHNTPYSQVERLFFRNLPCGLFVQKNWGSEKNCYFFVCCEVAKSRKILSPKHAGGGGSYVRGGGRGLRH